MCETSALQSGFHLAGYHKEKDKENVSSFKCLYSDLFTITVELQQHG